jgi:hypothetical protein
MSISKDNQVTALKPRKYIKQEILFLTNELK